MGCLCPKKKVLIEPNYIDDDPAVPIIEIPTKDIVLTVDDSFDEQKARKLVTELLNSDIEIYKNQLPDVLNLNSEEFKKLFEGDSDYDYSVKNKVKFKKLALKFENCSVLLTEWYKKGENYHECLKDIWRRFNVLFELSKLDDDALEKKLDSICKSKCWTTDIREEFKILIQNATDMSDKFKIFLEQDIKELDDVIKNIKKSQTAIEKKEKENKEAKNVKLDVNTKSIIEKILDSAIPSFLDNLNSEYSNNKISIEEKDKITKLTDNQKQQLIKSTFLKYATGDIGHFDLTKALEDAKTIGENLNYTKLFSSDTKKKAEIIINSNMTAHAILGLSFLNLCNNIYGTYELFSNSAKQIKIFTDRLNAIEASFYKHKNQIPLIDCDKYDEAMRQIEEIRLKFEEDKDNLQQLINEIEAALMDQKSEKNKRIFQAIVSGVVGVASGVAGGLTEGSNKAEYSIASIFSGINTVTNTVDIVKLQSNIKQYKQLLNRARSLENKIKEQIDILNQKYREIQKSDFPDIYK